MKDILIFGTGSGVVTVLNAIDITSVRIVGYIDNDSNKWGETYNGCLISPPHETNYENCDFVLIASQYVNEIYNQLVNQMNVSSEKIISFYDWFYNSGVNVKLELLQQVFSLNRLFSYLLQEDISCIDEATLKRFSEIMPNPTAVKMPAMLFVNHHYGGGSTVYQNTLIETELQGGLVTIFKLYIVFDYLIFIKVEKGSNKTYIVHMNLIDSQYFRNILSFFGITHIYVNQLVSLPVFELTSWIAESSVSYTYFFHDYFSACPSFNLLNNQGRYCFSETDFSICQSCIDTHLVAETVILINKQSINIAEWRRKFNTFLKYADKLIAPSNAARQIMLNYYPDLHIHVAEHCVERTKFTYEPQFAVTTELTIGFAGTLNYVKGADFVYQLLDEIRAEKLPIRLRVLGTTDRHNSTYESEDALLIVHGSYAREELPDLLHKYKISFVCIPTIVPETYSYTTTEVMASGYPIMTFPIGAPQERVLRLGAGWVLEGIEVKDIMKKLNYLLRNRQEIIQKAETLIKRYV